MSAAKWYVSGNWYGGPGDDARWMASAVHWTETRWEEDEPRSRFFRSWREAYAYAYAMARAS